MTSLGLKEGSKKFKAKEPNSLTKKSENEIKDKEDKANKIEDELDSILNDPFRLLYVKPLGIISKTISFENKINGLK